MYTNNRAQTYCDGLYDVETGKYRYNLNQILDMADKRTDSKIETLKETIKTENGETTITKIVDEKLKKTNLELEKITQGIGYYSLDTTAKFELCNKKINEANTEVTNLKNKCVLLNQIDDINNKITELEINKTSLLNKIKNIDKLYMDIINNYVKTADLESKITTNVNNTVLEVNESMDKVIKRSFLNDFYNEIITYLKDNYVTESDLLLDFSTNEDLDLFRKTINDKVDNNFLTKEDATEIYTTKDVFNEKTNQLNEKSTTLETNYTEINTKITELYSLINDLNEKVTKLTQTTTSIDNRLSTQGLTIESIKTETNNLGNNVKQNKTKLDTNTKALSELIEILSGLTSELKTHDEKITKLETDVGKLNGQNTTE